MIRNAAIALLLVSIAHAGAFHAPAIPVANRRAVQRACVGVRCARASTIALPHPSQRGVYAFPSQHALDVVHDYVQQHTLVPAGAPRPWHAAPAAPAAAHGAVRSSLLSGAMFLAVMKAVELSSAAIAWSLIAHACAGALGDLAGLYGESAVKSSVVDAASLKITAVSKAANSVTFAYIQTLATAAVGVGSFALAAAATGVVATAVQGLFAGDADFFRANVVHNVVAFEAFWLTYAGIVALTPAASVTYVGLAVSGAISGAVSAVTDGIDLGALAKRATWARCRGGVRDALRALRQGFKSMRKAVGARGVNSGILFVVYQAVYSTLVVAV